MTPSMLRQIWAIVEHSHSSTLLSLDDQSLVNWLVQQVEEEKPLNPFESEICSGYIRSKLSLIRDVAHSRRVPA
jgi:hypothetical protein